MTGDSLGRESQVTGVFKPKSRGATAGVSYTTGLGIRNNLSRVPVVALRLWVFCGHRTSDLRPRLSDIVASQLSRRALSCDDLLFEDVLHVEFDFVLSQDLEVLLLK